MISTLAHVTGGAVLASLIAHRLLTQSKGSPLIGNRQKPTTLLAMHENRRLRVSRELI
ncbi:hypothetical protein GCM10007875_10140 [Limnobacter litoralis]|uniref:Uncharacterized protein n=1 Tax=Limnobacter litoralis TaxID=481366 RepID=A0ABQ5YR65_9BURK|nr:hypothetical protein GCM10007875_10140 [Limnobacter litoralis]